MLPRALNFGHKINAPTKKPAATKATKKPVNARSRLMKKIKGSAFQKGVMSARGKMGKRSSPVNKKVNDIINNFINNAINEIVANYSKNSRNSKGAKKINKSAVKARASAGAFFNKGKKVAIKMMTSKNTSNKRLAHRTGQIKNPESGRWVKSGGSIHKSLRARGYN